MTDHDASEKMVGECGVCSNSLPVGANHAYTVCKHLFCISCLLRWHKANSKATCPMCRAPLYEDDANVQSVQEQEAVQSVQEAVQSVQEAVQSVQAVQETAAQGTWMTLQEMDFTHEEQSMHDHMMHVVNAHAEHYCRNNPMCTYMGTNNLCTIRDQDYEVIAVGIHNANCHYVIELHDSPRAFCYKFGRIEDIRMPHPMFQGMSWFVFRELVEILDDDTGHVHASWSQETQLIAIQGGDVKSLRQYVPRMRMSV